MRHNASRFVRPGLLVLMMYSLVPADAITIKFADHEFGQTLAKPEVERHIYE